MGSKRQMLAGQLGPLLLAELKESRRFVDLFTGSAAVATFVAEKADVPVAAIDLQQYAVTLANAVVGRTEVTDAAPLWNQWALQAICLSEANPLCAVARQLQAVGGEFDAEAHAKLVRECCSKSSGAFTRAYGGYYFDAVQAIAIDSLHGALPMQDPERSLCLAALIQAASTAAAAPGHTAQPFKPTETAAPYLFDSWRRDIWYLVRSALKDLSSRSAQVKGSAEVAEAVGWSLNVERGDLVFVDPPYSGVHYSRFYHVLESIARGNVAEVSGAGRYGPAEDRPRSEFSMKQSSQLAFEKLMASLAERRAKVIVTYPRGDTSNGLSGGQLRRIASEFFGVTELSINSRFSTLGGNGKQRSARQDAKEMILILKI